jgi:hypothetical protein
MNVVKFNDIYEVRYSYEEALARGDKQYSGRPCRHGHGTMRFMANKDCVRCRANIKNKARDKYMQARALKEPKSKPKPKSYTPPEATAKEAWAYRVVRISSRKSLRAEDLFPLLVDICPILEMPIDYGPSNNGPKTPDNYASLDKIDPSKGYVVGNLQVISKKANSMKSDATIEELRKFVKNITAILL